MKKIIITYEGKEYPSLRNFCIENNYNYRLVLQRIQSGKTLEEAIRNLDLNVINGKEVYYKGKYYPSITNLCDELNIKASTVQGRLKNGWSLEKAVSTPIRKTVQRVPEKLVYNGQTFSTLKELCETFGFNYVNTSTRLRRGYSFKEALETPLNEPKIPKKCSYNNKEYNSEKEMCLDNNVSYMKYLNLKKKGYSLEDAIKNAIVKNKKVEIDGHTYKSLVEASEKTGLSVTKIRYRCNSTNYKNYKKL